MRFKISNPFTTSLRFEEIITIFEELASLISNNHTLRSAIQELKLLEEDGIGKSKINKLYKAYVQDGKSISESIATLDYHKCNEDRKLIDLANNDAQLAELFRALAEEKQAEQNWRDATHVSLAGNLLFIVVAIFIVLLFSTKILPNFSELFTSFGAELPRLTIIIIGFSQLINQYFAIILLTVTLLIVAYKKISILQHIAIDIGQKYFPFTQLTNNLQKHLFIYRLSIFHKLEFLPTNSYLEHALSKISTSSVKNRLDYTESKEKLTTWLSENSYLPFKIRSTAKRASDSNRFFEEIAPYLNRRLNSLENYITIRNLITANLMKIVLIFTIGITIIAMYLPIFQLGSIT